MLRERQFKAQLLTSMYKVIRYYLTSGAVIKHEESQQHWINRYVEWKLQLGIPLRFQHVASFIVEDPFDKCYVHMNSGIVVNDLILCCLQKRDFLGNYLSKRHAEWVLAKSQHTKSWKQLKQITKNNHLNATAKQILKEKYHVYSYSLSISWSPTKGKMPALLMSCPWK